MGNIPNIILQNPYRILGVYANSPKKDIVANKSKAMAFIKVNRNVEFPLDLNGILPPLTRNIDMLNECEGSISIAKEQIRCAQFWFLCITPLDNIAFNYLVSGNITRAEDIWSKQETVSSLQNKAVCFLIEKKTLLAIREVEKLYKKYGDDYISKIDASCTLKMNGLDLLHQFIDTLSPEIDLQNLLTYDLSEEVKKYMIGQTVGPLVNKILIEVERSKKVDHQDAQSRIEAARVLVRHTREDFATLNKIMKSDDPQYQMVADKLGLEILQCGIDYFNNSEDQDKHITAMKMQKYAQSIVVGSLAKQRCDENVKILQKIIDELPPAEALVYDRYIVRSLSSLKNKMAGSRSIAPQRMGWIKDCLKKCGHYIGSIKVACGINHPYYIRKSTQVVDYILSDIIDVVNSQLDHINSYSGYGIGTPKSSIDDLREIIMEAWQLMFLMDEFDMDPIFKQNRFLPNRNTLKNIINQARVNVCKSESIDMRSEKLLFSEIETLSDCEFFLSVFPESKYKKEVDEKRRIIRFNSCNCLKDCHDLQRDYPNRKVEIDRLRDKILYRELEKCKSIEEYESFIYNYPNCKYVNEAQDRIDNLARSRRRKRILKTILCIIVALIFAGIIGFLYWDSIQKKEMAEQIAKQKEYALYDKIVNMGDSLSCTTFIESYPNSSYIDEVKQVLEEYEYHHLSSIDDCLDFVSNYPHSKYSSSVDSVISERAENLKKAMVENSSDYDVDKLRDFISKYCSTDNNSIKSAVTEVNKRFNELIQEQQEKAEKARQDSIRKEEEARKREEFEKYGTDANAWKTAKAEDTMNGYKEYLKRYPKGRHVQEANKNIIDLEVASVILSGDYGHLPSSQKISYGRGKNSTIHMTNSSGRTITILYSGVKSMKIILAAYQSRTIILPSSSYDVVATSPGVRSFYGTENLTGGEYESEYYIVSH